MSDIINKGAKYIGLFKDNHTILVDIRDILDILPTQFILQNGMPISIILTGPEKRNIFVKEVLKHKEKRKNMNDNFLINKKIVVIFCFPVL